MYYCPETMYLDPESYDMNHGAKAHGLYADVPTTSLHAVFVSRPRIALSAEIFKVDALGPRDPLFVKQYAQIVYTLVAQIFQGRRLAASRTLEEGQVVGTATPLDLLWWACMALSVWINVRRASSKFLRSTPCGEQ
ncbi:hypothetical protein EDD85DRAFT_793702 [Armillaria nabsnona]|nr:hypothetical protein EDD85DRAFT_793698 [Armillaria nabsnona]KAK0229797.1 hypothetical protein EDD85DRAFT_793702 [Armillaria nabsnona]